MGSLWVEEPVHTTWSRFCTVNHRASASNYQLSNMKYPGRDSKRQPQRFKASTLTATSPSPHVGKLEKKQTKQFFMYFFSHKTYLFGCIGLFFHFRQITYFAVFFYQHFQQDNKSY